MLKRKADERKLCVRHRPRRVKPKGDHLRNGCGSEAGQDERKEAESRVLGTGQESMRDQAGKNGESEEARAEARTVEATERRKREEKERKKQKAE